ncbi:MAG: hypothetical protein QOE45_1697 [Frankiaceae bacterium]|jgi:hypothetical protein|nr:hypothetical protein [Frankiaceae bacterium]
MAARVALGTAVLLLATSLSACTSVGSDLTVPAADATPPTAAALQADVPHRPLANVLLGSPAARGEMGENDKVHVVARGDDTDGGVKDVRIWVATTQYRTGSTVGPGAATVVASSPSSAVPGGTAKSAGSVTWDFDVPTRLGGYQGVKLDLFAEVENFHGGKVRTSTLTLDFHRKDLELFVIPLTDDDGGHPFTATAADFAALVGRVNGVYSGTGIRFRFDPATDWAPRADTRLNREQVGFQMTATAIATARPTQIVAFLRWGPDDTNRTGNGNAFPPPGANPRPPSVTDADQRFVMLPDLLDASFSFLNLHNGSFVAHELGHYLGLYHTFPGWTDLGGPVYKGVRPASAAAADQAVVDFIAANGGTIDALDGDSLSDTPPDPAQMLYDAHGQDICTNASVTVTGMRAGAAVSYTVAADHWNVMSYYASCVPAGTPPVPQTFTFQQIQAMHNGLKRPQRSGLVP